MKSVRLLARARPRRGGHCLALLSIAALVISIGCGGGGGGGGNPSAQAFNRSYAFSSGGNEFDLSVDSIGRFTIFAKNATGAPNGAVAQGTMTTSGAIAAQSSDGTLQFSGQESADASTLAGQVQRGGQTLFSFTAALVPAGTTATPGIAQGTFTTGSTSPAVTVDLTDDSTGHGTLYASVNGVVGGGPVSIAPDGTVQTADGQTTGQWVLTGAAGPNFTITKLNGTAVNQQVSLLKTSRAKWTVLVYLNAANDLRDFGPLNVNQMEQVGSTADMNIVVQWKQASCFDCGASSWHSTRRYFITKNNDIAQNGGNGTDVVQSTLIQDLGSTVDMGDPNTLHSFITWGQQNYPADHTALVIWDHGSGWFAIPGYKAAPKRAPIRPRAVSFDDATLSEIDTWELSQAINVTPQVDMVVFDASLMQMTEVAYEIRGVTGVVVGSEESPPGFGYPYQVFLADLAANPAMTAAQFGADIVNQTLTYYSNNNSLNPDQNNTQSAVDTSKLTNLATSMTTFANTLLAHATDQGAQLATARSAAEPYDPSAGYGDFKDLYDYADKVKTNTTATDLQAAASGVQQALQSALIANGHGPNHPRSNGLSIYVPAPGSYDANYNKLAIAKDTHWPQWLQGQKQ